MQDGLDTSQEAVSLPSASPTTSGPVNVLIMNLPFRVRWQDLKDLCRQACPIERADVALEIDGRSRGFGEVVCPSRADAEKLFSTFDGYEWQNRRLSVIIMEESGQNTNQAQANYRHAQTGSPQQVPLHTAGTTNERATVSGMGTTTLQPLIPTDDKLLFVGNLPFSMQWQDLKDFLRPAGRVLRTDVSMSSDGRSRGWGTALFYSSQEAQRAVDMFNDSEVEGRRIKVRLDRLGGRGVPTYAAAPNARFQSDRSMSATGPLMQQQHPSSYPLQQNPLLSSSAPGRFGMPQFQQQSGQFPPVEMRHGASSGYPFGQAYTSTPGLYGFDVSQNEQQQQQQQQQRYPPQDHQGYW